MWYEINVSERIDAHYVHLFATHERSLTNEKQMKKVYGHLITKFPSPDFCVSVIKCEKIDESIEVAIVKLLHDSES